MTRAVIMAGWDSVPHLSEAEKKRLLDASPPHLRDARSKGIPALGSGAIYPISLEDVTVEDFTLPRHWPRAYGMDVGWKYTACTWGAWDREPGKDIVYLYREYKRGQAEPASHVASIQAAGKELYGAIDPASNISGQRDGNALFDEYTELGLNLVKAKNTVEAGLFEVYQRLTTGRLKIFKSLTQTLTEFRLYRRDDKGRVVKENDHLMDAMRYLLFTLDQVCIWSATETTERRERYGSAGWMSN